MSPITSVAVDNTKLPTSVSNDEIVKSEHQQAATTIQAFYRGYRQRKLYHKMVENVKLLEQPKNKHPNRRTGCSETDICNKNQGLALLLPHVSNTSHPYNFINTVRRKLNLAIGSYTPTTKANVAVQSSFADSVCRTPTQEIFEKTKNDILLVLEKSSKASRSKSVLSHKTLNDKRKVSLNGSKKSKSASRQLEKPSKKPQDSDSDTSRNIQISLARAV